MTPNDFIAKWRKGGVERAEAQSFFNDLCHLVGHKTPREADPDRIWFAFEYGAEKTQGGKGFADAWLKGKFGWEAKGTKRSLQDAYAQLKMYADDLQNPPLLVVCDLQTFEIHTNFTNTVKEVHRFTVDDLAKPEVLRLVRAMFFNPDELRPGTRRSDITAEAAEKFADLAQALRGRKHPPLEVAHFLNRLLFCMFAEDIGLLPDSLFTRMVEGSQDDPDAFEANARQLFAAMRKGGQAGFVKVEWFNGGLFDSDLALRLERDELKTLLAACRLHWDQIDPSIFGTLFERGLDPAKRSQLGAHYTDPATIQKIVRPVVVEPLLAEWEAVKSDLAKAIAKDKTKTKVGKAIETPYFAFLERLRHFTVLDPACGSGNFLYLSLRALKDVEARVIFEAEQLGLPRQQPSVGPGNVRGIELNEYAAELARITVWIGEIQWMIQNGYGARKNPILQPLDQIQCRDALLNPDGSEAAWPDANVIVGNPPFLGAKKHWSELGREYTETMRAAYKGRVPGMADLVCFWFEKANDAIKAGTTQCAGLVSTNSIRAGASRKVLEHATETARIFEAWSDEDWVNEGASVRVSLVCFGQSGQGAELDGKPVAEIYPDLTANDGEGGGVDLTNAAKLPENAGCSFVATVKAGSFDIPGETARAWLKLPNPNGRGNAEVVRPWANGVDVSRRPSDTWIVDFGVDTTEEKAAMYEVPFAHVVEHVKPARDKSNRAAYRERWWRLAEPIPKMRAALAPLSRYIATPADGKQRIFAWLDAAVLPDHQLVVIARDDDTMFGLVHSRIHEVWSVRAEISRMGVGNTPRYKPPVHFEKFPFPEGMTPNIPAKDCENDPHAQRIAAAARALVEARDNWLNPADWVEWTRTPEEERAGFPARPVAKPGHEAALKKQTLTNLYNANPDWLKNLHRAIDQAVAAAYGWEWPLADAEILKRLMALNQARSQPGP